MNKKAKGLGTDAAVVQESLRPYAIADKLRTLRLRHSMGLAQLAEHTGFSPAMLSRLENGRLVPTLPTLTRIALVFSVGQDYFFSDPRKRQCGRGDTARGAQIVSVRPQIRSGAVALRKPRLPRE